MMILFGVIFLGTVFALVFIIYDLSNKIVKEREDFAEERQILLNRIENPKYRPPLTPSEKTQDLAKLKELREETEQFGLVGKILG